MRSDETGEAGQSSRNIDAEALRSEYLGKQSRFEKLRTEALSIIDGELKRSGISLSSIESRTKDFDSALSVRPGTY